MIQIVRRIKEISHSRAYEYMNRDCMNSQASRSFILESDRPGVDFGIIQRARRPIFQRFERYKLLQQTSIFMPL